MIVFGLRKAPQWQRLQRDCVRFGHAGLVAVKRYEFAVASAEFSGRRLVFFSDLHWDQRDTLGSEALVEGINELQADWLVCGGDIIRYLEHLQAALHILKQLKASCKKLAVLGNWERQHQWRSTECWKEDFAKAGFTLLVNDIFEGSSCPVFVGLDDYRWQNPEPALAAAFCDDPRPVICVTHSPDAVAEPPDCFLGHLALAGHTHGGQLCLPGMGPVYTSSHYWRKFSHGWFRRIGQKPTDLYVSRGIGCNGNSIFRRRLFCPPELIVIDFVI